MSVMTNRRRAQDAHHLTNGRQGITAMMQIHIGKHSVHAGIRQWQGQTIGLMEFYILELAQVAACLVQHGC
jgi:hypothetical protein